MKIIIADDHALFRDGLHHMLGLLGLDALVIEAEDHPALTTCVASHTDVENYICRNDI